MGLLKKYKYIILGMIMMIGLGIFLIFRKEPVKLQLNESYKKVVEYGQEISILPQDYLVDNGKLGEVTCDHGVVNEVDKTYPKVGLYAFTFHYKKQIELVEVEVKDTISPELKVEEEIEIEEGQEIDFNDYVTCSDLSKTNVEFVTDDFDANVPGDYEIKVIVKDSYQNKTEGKLLVSVLEKEEEVLPSIEEKTQVKEPVKPPVTPSPNPAPIQQPTIELSSPYINQYDYGAPMGCEGAALLQALQSKGYASGIDLYKMLDNMPYTDDENPYHGYVSSPYKTEPADKIFQSIFPNVFTPYANTYGPCVNTTGYSTAQLVNELKAGHPSVVYVTYKFESPIWMPFSFGDCVYNMHVMTLIGYNPNNGQYKVMDPVSGEYWVDGNVFEAAYNALKFAITVK